jgi:hypothetical protein
LPAIRNLRTMVCDPSPSALVTGQRLLGRLSGEAQRAWHADSLQDSIRKARNSLREPMRVALVGQIKRGKSTLTNALLKRQLVATGILEKTFSVTELYYSEKWEGFVVFRNGERRRIEPSDLDAVTVRDTDNLKQLRAIDRVCVGDRVALLRDFRLIDTPGLGSIHGHDSVNALALLGIEERQEYEEQLAQLGKTGRDLHRDTVVELGNADAVLFLFSSGLADDDAQVVTRFVGESAGAVTPLTAIGLLSMCDSYWSQLSLHEDRPDPWEHDPLGPYGGRHIAEGYLRRPEIRRLFYDVVPVAGLVAAGAWTLTGHEIDVLTSLARTEPARLMRELRVAKRFAQSERLGLPVGPAERRLVFDKLGAWGVLRACRYLRDNVRDEELRRRLDEDSGVGRLRRLIVSHFGNRAAVIKLDAMMRAIRAEVDRHRAARLRSGLPPDRPITAIADELEAVELGTQDLAELRALGWHYRGEVALNLKEAAQLAQVTGEDGEDLPSRLGVPEVRDLPTLQRIAEQRIHYWLVKHNDGTLDSRTRELAGTVWNSYGRIALRLSADGPPDAAARGGAEQQGPQGRAEGTGDG